MSTGSCKNPRSLELFRLIQMEFYHFNLKIYRFRSKTPRNRDFQVDQATMRAGKSPKQAILKKRPKEREKGLF